MHSVITLILGRFVVGFSSGMRSSVCTFDAFNAGCPFENLIMLEFIKFLQSGMENYSVGEPKEHYFQSWAACPHAHHNQKLWTKKAL